ncbi:MAG: hypothetical protein SGILL_005684 [Bacillariaceae sp.]
MKFSTSALSTLAFVATTTVPGVSAGLRGATRTGTSIDIENTSIPAIKEPTEGKTTRQLNISSGNTNWEDCLEALAEADTTKDSQLDKEEYLTFLKTMGPPGEGFLENVEVLEDLPQSMKANFFALAYRCAGANPDGCPDEPAVSFVGDNSQYQVCASTNASISHYLSEEGSDEQSEEQDSPTA